MALDRLREASQRTSDVFKMFSMGKAAPSPTAASKGGPAAAPSAESKLVEICEKFELHGGPFITDIIMARAGDRMLGGLEDQATLQMTWYRQAGGGDFDELPGVKGGFYQPSADDIGARVLCRATALEDEGMSAFGEWGPLAAPPDLTRRVEDAIEKGAIALPVEREGTFNCQRTLQCGPAALLLKDRAATVDAAEGGEDEAVPPTAPAPGAAGESEAPDLDQALFCPLVPGVQLLLTAADVRGATLVLPQGTGAAGGAQLGMDGPTRVPLKFLKPQDRDACALVLRQWIEGVEDAPAHEGSTAEASGEAAEAASAEEQELDEQIGDTCDVDGTGGSGADSATSSQESAALQQEVQALRSRLADATRALDAAQTKAAAAKKQAQEAKRELKSSTAQVTALQASLSEARTAADTLRRAKEKLEVEVAGASSSAKQSGADAAAKATLIKSLRGRLEEAEADTAHERAAAQDAASRADALAKRVAELEANLEAAAANASEHEEASREGSRALEQVKVQLSAAEAARDEAQAAAAGAKHKVKALEGEVVSLRGALAEARSSAAEATSAAKEAVLAQERAKKQVETLEQELDSAKAEVEQAQAQLAQLRLQADRLEAAEAELATATSELGHLRDSLDDVTAERNSLKRKVTSLKRDLAKTRAPPPAAATPPPAAAAAQDSVSDLKQQLAALRAENGALKAAAAKASPPAPQTSTSGWLSGTVPPRQASGSGSYGGVKAAAGGRGTVRTAPATSLSLHPGSLASSSPAGSNGEVVRELRRLVADLTSELQDRDELIGHHKATKAALASRITALEAQLAGGSEE